MSSVLFVYWIGSVAMISILFITLRSDGFVSRWVTASAPRKGIISASILLLGLGSSYTLAWVTSEVFAKGISLIGVFIGCVNVVVSVLICSELFRVLGFSGRSWPTKRHALLSAAIWLAIVALLFTGLLWSYPQRLWR